MRMHFLKQQCHFSLLLASLSAMVYHVSYRESLLLHQKSNAYGGYMMQRSKCTRLQIVHYGKSVTVQGTVQKNVFVNR